MLLVSYIPLARGASRIDLSLLCFVIRAQTVKRTFTIYYYRCGVDVCPAAAPEQHQGRQAAAPLAAAARDST